MGSGKYSFFKDISYLRHGSARQRDAWEALVDSQVTTVLQYYRPLLTGTVPIGIDTPKSDLDIVCCYGDRGGFCELVDRSFSHFENYILSIDVNADTVVCNFKAFGELFEIYASPQPSLLSNAYRHMIVEHRLLGHVGEEFRQKIIRLKLSGIKTEPAFCRLLGLDGNAFEQMLALYDMTDRQLKVLIQRSRQLPER